MKIIIKNVLFFECFCQSRCPSQKIISDHGGQGSQVAGTAPSRSEEYRYFVFRPSSLVSFCIRNTTQLARQKMQQEPRIAFLVTSLSPMSIDEGLNLRFRTDPELGEWALVSVKPSRRSMASLKVLSRATRTRIISTNFLFSSHWRTPEMRCFSPLQFLFLTLY